MSGWASHGQTREESEKTMAKLIEQRLCASAHNFAPAQSIYRWRGEIYEHTEGRVSPRTPGATE